MWFGVIQMAKKKSKTQKKKQNIKRKIKQETKKEQLVPTNEVKYNVAITEPERFKKKKENDSKKVTNNKNNNNNNKDQKKNNVTNQKKNKKTPKKQEYSKNKKQNNKTTNKGKVVKNTDVIYNVALTKSKEEIEKNKNKKKKFNLKEIINNIKNKLNNKKKQPKEINKKNKKQNINQIYKTNKQNIVPKVKKEKIKVEKIKEEKVKPVKPKNIFLRILYEFWHNLNVLFDAILIITFIFFVLGLLKIDLLEKNTIIYICGLIVFLMIVAISYNKHIEGWIFTLLLCGGMGYAIYKINYTYDFINALNTEMYEYKTYYIVTFDNPTNRSLYNISNKKVGLIKNNNTNIERYLNTKLKTNYVEYDDINIMFDDFYDQKLRAVIVRDNEYKYLENNTQNNKAVKILYEFQVNGKK